MGLRSVDFWYNGSKITNLAANFTSYQTSYLSSNLLYHAENVFDTSLSKTGIVDNNGWASNYSTTNQRIICVFDTAQTFDEIRVNNQHGTASTSGDETDRGAKNVKITISTDAISDTTYNAAIANSTVVFDGQFDQHVSSDVEDEQILILSHFQSYSESTIKTQGDYSLKSPGQV